MSPVKIITDSSTGLPESYVKELSIEVLPLNLHFDGKDYRDGVDIKTSDFYTRMTQSDAVPSTSQVSEYAFEQAFRQYLEQEFEILALPISKGISSTMQSALSAQGEFPGAPIEIVDTQLVAMALSFQVLVAARAAAAGASLAECKKIAEDAYSKIGVYFTVDNLKWLAAGGRINSAKRFMGTVLNIKPLLQIREGKIEAVESVRSSNKAIQRMVQLVERDIAGRTPVRVSVFHALMEDTAKEVLDQCTRQFNAVESILAEVSPVIGAHTGPGTLSIAYMAG
ncbi:MAG TPA: DegV family protein [Bellilinea sp.]|nr:DegV family protein [Bellilinea sp.]